MALTTEVSSDRTTVKIRISGRFDFNLHREFREAYKQASESTGSVIIDLAQTDYMDSSALGMLLVLRDRVGGDEANISVINCRPEIKKIFAVSNLDKLFAVQ